MALTREEVRQIAELAKLDLSDHEVDIYAQQLSEILSYFEKLQELDTSQIPPTASVLPLSNVLRSDVAQEPLPPQQVIGNAPQAAENQFLVSAVLEAE